MVTTTYTYRMDESFNARVDRHENVLEINVAVKERDDEFRAQLNDLLDMTELSETSKEILAGDFYESLDELQVIELMRNRRV